jgi:hypothetical protein
MNTGQLLVKYLLSIDRLPSYHSSALCVRCTLTWSTSTLKYTILCTQYYCEYWSNTGQILVKYLLSIDTRRPPSYHSSAELSLMCKMRLDMVDKYTGVHQPVHPVLLRILVKYWSNSTLEYTVLRSHHAVRVRGGDEAGGGPGPGAGGDAVDGVAGADGRRVRL